MSYHQLDKIINIEEIMTAKPIICANKISGDTEYA